MNKSLLLATVLTLFLSLDVLGANIRYGDTFISMYQPDLYDDHKALYDTGLPFLVLNVDILNTGMELSAWANVNIEESNVFVKSKEGDVVDATYFESQTSFFEYGKHSEDWQWIDTHADYSIVLNFGDSVYLAFESERNLDYPVYGWMQLTLGADGTLGVTGSAWDLDGGPVVVGFIPEPRTVLLLLTGFSLLALSRRSFGCQTGGNRL